METMGQYQQLMLTYVTEFGTKLIAVILFWFIGRWLIGLVGRMLQGVLERQEVDTTSVAPHC
jgi:small conductance mechanosensitive channel